MHAITIGINAYPLSEVDAFYGPHPDDGQLTPHDTIVTATGQSGIVGAVRLCPEHGLLVLRTMEVAEAHQRRGIGTMLLAELDKLIGREECWGIAIAHLDRFYGRIGFRFVPDEAAPPHLYERIRHYRRENAESGDDIAIVIMHRKAKT